MFKEYTTLDQMQAILWDFYKDVHGYRPRHWTQQEWNSREFLQKEFDNLGKVVDNMTPDEKIVEGWHTAPAGNFEDFLAQAVGPVRA